MLRPIHPLRRWAGVCVLVVAVTLPACTGPDTGTPTEPTEEITISGFAYEPESIVLNTGTTVRWTNEDMFAHTVTSGEPREPTGRFDGDLGDASRVDARGTTFETTFTKAGRHPYYCRLHPRMVGVVIVRG